MNIDYRWDSYESTVILSCTLAFFVTAFGRLAISPLVPLITSDFGISNTEIGIALSGMWVTYSLTQLPSGLLADRYGERVIILIALGGTGITSLVVAFAPIYVIFLGGSMLLGAVGGLHYSAATALLSRTCDDTGMAIGIHNIGMPAGGLIAPILASWVGTRYGWRPATILVLLIAVPVLLIFVRGVRSRAPPAPEEPIRDKIDRDRVSRILSRPTVIFTVCIGVVSMFVVIGLFTFIPTFLVEYSGCQTTAAGGIFTGFFVILIPLQAAVGYISDLYGYDITLIGCFFACGSGILLLIYGASTVSLVTSIMLVAVGSSSVPVVDSRLVDSFSGNDVGTEFGLPRMIYGLVGGTGAVVIGLLSDTFTWTISFGFLAAISLIAALVICSNELFSLGY